MNFLKTSTTHHMFRYYWSINNWGSILLFEVGESSSRSINYHQSPRWKIHLIALFQVSWSFSQVLTFSLRLCFNVTGNRVMFSGEDQFIEWTLSRLTRREIDRGWKWYQANPGQEILKCWYKISRVKDQNCNKIIALFLSV